MPIVSGIREIGIATKTAHLKRVELIDNLYRLKPNVKSFAGQGGGIVRLSGVPTEISFPARLPDADPLWNL